MRLLNATTRQLEEFVADIPPYAILSHTWGEREVTFADLSSLPTTTTTASVPLNDKVENTCELALQHGLSHVWIDSCCIDKSSSAELTEAINSMWNWYQLSVVCYAFLDDFGPNDSTFASCKWFTRGWTLQELLAPKQVEFYDRSWNFRGTRDDLLSPLSSLTRIPNPVLQGRMPLSECSVASRMSWAAGRKTTRIEDAAYSLLGIFNVHMPAIYGEGINAFRRLQEEIVKRSNDLTLFAWQPSLADIEGKYGSRGLLAGSPDGFLKTSGVRPFFDDFSTRFAITNQGLWISGDAPIKLITYRGDGPNSSRYAIYLGMDSAAQAVGIYLRKIGPRLFYRDVDLSMAGVGVGDDAIVDNLDIPDYHILIDPVMHPTRLAIPFRDGALHVPSSQYFTICDAIPTELWDHMGNIFLKPKPYQWCQHITVLGVAVQFRLGGVTVPMVVLCDCRIRRQVKLLSGDKIHVFAASLFGGRNRRTSVEWRELEIEAPDLMEMGNTAEVTVKDRTFNVEAHLIEVEPISIIKMLNLRFNVEETETPIMW
ncbi:hypothetical protein JX266_001132 [Neoarthrinium moseri]|nr:hypothetical protein JX266_001132 [Neoarthrinium moseri]